jgi:hypothetical protein
MSGRWQHPYDTVNTTISVGDVTMTGTCKTMPIVSRIDVTGTDITSFTTIVGH